MPRIKETNPDFKHGELLSSITVKAIFVRENESFCIDEQGIGYQTIDIDGLEANKSFQFKNIVIEKRAHFSYKFCLFSTKKTEVTKLKKNIKKQYVKQYESFEDAKPGRVTNLKCILMEETEDEGKTLKFFDGSIFKMKIKEPNDKKLKLKTNKAELLFIRKSNTYNFVWKTGLTQLLPVTDDDEFYDDIKVPVVEIYDDPNDIPENQKGKWVAMLTTVSPPFSYGKFSPFH